MATLLSMPNPVRSSQKAQPAPFLGSILLPSVHGCQAEVAEPSPFRHWQIVTLFTKHVNMVQCLLTSNNGMVKDAHCACKAGLC